MPLPPTLAHDKLAWLPSKNGLFSIKRGYWFAQSQSPINLNSAESSNTSLASNLIFYKTIWNHNVLSRLAVWSWQDAQNRLCLLTHFSVKETSTL